MEISELKTKTRFKDALWFDKLLDITIGGVGGIGSNLSPLLSRIGHTLYIYEFDEVEEENLAGQHFCMSQVGMQKVDAVMDFCMDYSNEPASNFISLGRLEENGLVTNVCFSCFDNMSAREVMFNAWLKQCEKNPEGLCLYIDGRLLAEVYQVFCVDFNNKNQIEEYKKTIFKDEEIEIESCTYKQTSHFAFSIAADMVKCLNNSIINFYNGSELATVPFRIDEAGIIFNKELTYVKS